MVIRSASPEEDDLADALRPGQQHDKTVDPTADPPVGGIPGALRADEIFVVGLRLLVAPLQLSGASGRAARRGR